MVDDGNTLKISLEGQSFQLFPQKAMYWKERTALLLADLHIGKSGHFRKHGIPVPGTLNQTNLDILDLLIEKLNPDKLMILGDLFHSRENKEWEQFELWREDYRDLELFLIVGNHDILPAMIYHASGIHLFKKLKMGPFLFLHDRNDIRSDPKDKYLLSGHIHPAVKLRGKGRQSMKLPCFCFGQKKGLLPAFGQFTGTHVIDPHPGDRVYAVAENRIFPIDTAEK